MWVKRVQVPPRLAPARAGFGSGGRTDRSGELAGKPPLRLVDVVSGKGDDVVLATKEARGTNGRVVPARQARGDAAADQTVAATS